MILDLVAVVGDVQIPKSGFKSASTPFIFHHSLLMNFGGLFTNQVQPSYPLLSTSFPCGKTKTLFRILPVKGKLQSFSADKAESVFVSIVSNR